MKNPLSPLAIRISLAVLLAVGAVGLLATYFLTIYLSRDLEAQFQQRGKTLSLLLSRLVSEGIAEENLDLVNRASYILEEPGVEYVNVYTEFWDLIETYPPRTVHPHGTEDARAYFAANPESRFFYRAYPERGMYDFYAPVLYRPFLDSPSLAVGFVELDISDQALRLARQRMFWLHLEVAALLCLLTTALLAGLLHRLLVRPVRRLKREMELFARGETPVAAEDWPGDEIGDLARQFQGMARIISERSRALAEQRLYLDSLLRSSDHGIVATDSQLAIRYFNPRAEEIYSLAAAEVLGKTVPEIHRLKAVEPERLEKALVLVREHGFYTYQYHEEERGRTRSLESTIFPIRGEGHKVSGYLLMVKDVTQRLQFQRELERSNQELEQFAYVASHDLQEPVRVINGFIQLLEKREGDHLDAKGREYMAFIIDAGDRMKALINDLLAYSRVGTQAQPPSAINLDRALERALANLQLLIKEENVHIEREPLPTVWAEAGQMTQLFQNLLANAIRYHQPGRTPLIKIGVERREGEWLISVSDNGIGIDPRFFDRIFKIFQRLHTREDYPGTGIGLALCQKIVERHRGRIQVESRPGEGSIFSFTLPIDHDDKRKTTG